MNLNYDFKYYIQLSQSTQFKSSLLEENIILDNTQIKVFMAKIYTDSLKKTNDLKENIILGEKFLILISSLSSTTKDRNLLMKALKQSNKDEKKFHEQKIHKLNIECIKWRKRLNQNYLNGFDNKILKDLCIQRHKAWIDELQSMQKIIRLYDNANENYLVYGMQIQKIIY